MQKYSWIIAPSDSWEFLNWVRIYDIWLQIETFWTTDRYSYQKQIPEIYFYLLTPKINEVWNAPESENKHAMKAQDDFI